MLRIHFEWLEFAFECSDPIWMVQICIWMVRITFKWFKSHPNGRICFRMVRIPVEWLEFVFECFELSFECFESRPNDSKLLSDGSSPVWMFRISILMVRICIWMLWTLFKCLNLDMNDSNFHSNSSNPVRLVGICIRMLRIPFEWFKLAFEWLEFAFECFKWFECFEFAFEWF